MLTVFGSPGSQPTRSIYWACLLEQFKFQVRIVHPAQSLREGNPRGQIPWIKEGDFFLTEMAAILCYLADEHGWHQLYPPGAKVRAQIHQYLHLHHSLVRLCTYKMMAVYVVKPVFGTFSPDLSGYNGWSWGQRELIASAMNTEDHYAHGLRIVRSICDFLEKNYLQDDREFLFGFENPSIADLACYEEIAQLQQANLFDYSSYSKLSRWLQAMSSLPYHNDVHAYNLILGDIFTHANTAERFAHATQAGLAALAATGLVTIDEPVEA